MNARRNVTIGSVWNESLFFRVNVVFAAVGILYLIA